MMPVPKREPLGRPPGASRPARSRPKARGLWGFHPPVVSDTGFTLVEVVVSSSILAFALAGSFRGWSQGQALVQQANQRQVLLDAVEQDLQRQQGFVIRELRPKAPWACDVSLVELKTKLQALPHDLPEAVERQWVRKDQPPGLAIRYTAPNLQPRQRLLALRGGAGCG